MKKVYYLASCSTCIKILDEVEKFEIFEKQNIKEESITGEQLNQMKELAGSFEALFSRRAQKYKSLGLKDKQLTEEDYKNYILQEYTFLKRPVFVSNDKIFVGNSKKVVASLVEALK